MNKIIFSVFLSISLSGQHYSQVFWETIKSPVDVELRRVFYLDSLHLWAAGDSGTIIFSSDMGKSWNIQSSGLPERIEDLFFLNDSLGWALTWSSTGTDYQSKILHTVNGGLNWTSTDYRIPNILLNAIFFLDSLNGWICGAPFDFSFTSNGGATWNAAIIDTGSSNLPVNEIKFSTPQYGFAVGGAHDIVGVVWQTTNGGELWKSYSVGPDHFMDFVFQDSVTAFALTAEIEGFYFTGKLRFDLEQSTWDYEDLDLYANVTGIDLRTDYEAWGTIGTITKSFIVSNDSLRTWELIDTPDSMYFAFDIDFADSIHGIAVGEEGNIFRYIPQKPVSVLEDNIKTPNEFILYQNYPNPFNPTTKIKYTISSNVKSQMSKVILKVYDVLGNKVATLVDEEKNPGSYEIEFNADEYNLSSGIYFYQIKAGDFISAKKLILMK
ncbi:MAG TPA: T9SS type A sorting domain-containing protein [Ignavibacteriaceae bacterium]|nr:T9SS type A sorting domain-containing protein [Ignavibacteriaceae bacterium]